ncbi:PfkB family carbohydrate kinase [Kribbella sp. VKM Ac-2569]|uniref:PfkB family carbohydrate kinase n=1 Tax=Kribbella sp. VKM Ac-2569 TaxID=2512220 RepID=UPI0018E57E72|nr:PfkB family carbohydrate kinase [Kribbella sp. VKM Ac-2569]
MCWRPRRGRGGLGSGYGAVRDGQPRADLPDTRRRGRATSGTTVVVKNGVEPTEIHANTSTTAPVPPVDEVRDTTGVGDAFAAGFLSAVLADADAVEAVKAGHTLARRVLREPGATLSMTADENGTACD